MIKMKKISGQVLARLLKASVANSQRSGIGM